MNAVDEVNSKGQSPLHLSSIWPRGIEILLETSGKKLVNRPDRAGWLPISYALMNDCFESFHQLLNIGSVLSSPAWIKRWERPEELLARAAGNLPGYMGTVVETLTDRRKRLYHLAKERLPTAIWDDLRILDDRVLDKDAKWIQQILLDMGIEVPEELMVHVNGPTVYHWGRLSGKLDAEGAEMLFGAGFLDIDVPNTVGLTPLQEICLYRTRFAGLDERLGLINWYLSKGADPDRRVSVNVFNFVAGLSMSQMVACFVGMNLVASPAVTTSSSVSQYLEELSVQSRTLIENSIRNREADACICNCSEEGCSPIIALLKGLEGIHEVEHWEDEILPLSKRIQKTRLARTEVLKWLDGIFAKSLAPIPPDVVRDIICFETFDTLGLTHTCCWGCSNMVQEPLVPRFRPSEVEEIREEESPLLEEHKQLVAKFIQVFDERKESLTSFIRGFWRTEMLRVLTTRNRPTAEQLAELRKIGVIVHNTDEAEGARLYRSASRHVVDLDSDSGEAETESEQHTDGTRLYHEKGSSKEISDDEWFWVLENFRE